jgi:hypothetical protein
MAMMNGTVPQRVSADIGVHRSVIVAHSHRIIGWLGMTEFLVRDAHRASRVLDPAKFGQCVCAVDMQQLSAIPELGYHGLPEQLAAVAVVPPGDARAALRTSATYACPTAEGTGVGWAGAIKSARVNGPPAVVPAATGYAPAPAARHNLRLSQ